MVERFTRATQDTVDYQVTIDRSDDVDQAVDSVDPAETDPGQDVEATRVTKERAHDVRHSGLAPTKRLWPKLRRRN